MFNDLDKIDICRRKEKMKHKQSDHHVAGKYDFPNLLFHKFAKRTFDPTGSKVWEYGVHEQKSC